jgi:predicted LPLAT superfamily acyltransferase
LNQPPASLALEISGALNRGEWVGLLADRTLHKERSVSVDFLGTPARFPVGPYIIAGMFNAPLVSVFPLYIDGCYEIFCEVINESVSIPRAQRQEILQEYIVKFVGQLEKYVKMAPYNWFNFFDYWEER